jgi:hypothetical protein
LKAKLMLVRRDMGIDQLFEMAAEAASPTQPAPVEKVPQAVPVSSEKADSGGVKIPVSTTDEGDQGTLEDAVFFLKDLGVWDHYQKFLADRKQEG